MPLGEILGQHLIDSGFGTTLGLDVFIDYQPTEPNSLIVINEFPGLATRVGIDAVERSIQLVVRDFDPTTAHTRIWGIFNLLDQIENKARVIGGRAMSLYARQPPFKIAVDEQRRFLYGFNMGVTTTRE